MNIRTSHNWMSLLYEELLFLCCVYKVPQERWFCNPAYYLKKDGKSWKKCDWTRKVPL